MSFKVLVFCAALAIARAGYVQPAVRYAHAAPIAVPAPLTYTFPPTIKAEPIAPVVTSSYGFSTAHTPVPAPIIRAEPIHHAIPAPAPIAFAAPAIHAVPAPAPVALAAPAAFNFGGHGLGFSGHQGFGHNYAAGFGFAAGPSVHVAPFAAHSAPAPFAFGHSFATHSAPAPFTFGHGFAAHSAPAPFAFGHGFAASKPIGFAGNFGFGHSSYGNHF